MQPVSGVRAVVQGDLPAEIMERVAASVRKAVLHELADVDLGPRLKQVPLQPAQPAADRDLAALPGSDDLALPVIIPFPLGIWFKPDETPFDPQVDVTLPRADGTAGP